MKQGIAKMRLHALLSPPARGRGLKRMARAWARRVKCRPPHGGVD